MYSVSINCAPVLTLWAAILAALGDTGACGVDRRAIVPPIQGQPPHSCVFANKLRFEFPRIQDVCAHWFEIAYVARNDGHAVRERCGSDERAPQRPWIRNMQYRAAARHLEIDGQYSCIEFR